MSILDVLKKVFPKPNIPQKRYVGMFLMVMYFAVKAYVAQTPETSDDHYPDIIKGYALDLLADNDDN